MENHSYSSYPDSGDSSPRSREIDLENPSWDELPNYKVKFMCSYGGKIQPRPHDNQLAYVGGDTKILAVDRSIRFSSFISKLSSLCDAEVCFKYQLPGEDLDALISVTNDEDLEHMMIEYDRLHRASAKPARLRLFLFTLNPPPPAEPKSDWFVDALNSLPIQSLDGSSPPAAAAKQTNPDFLFGLEKGSAPPAAAAAAAAAANLQESIPETVVSGVPPSETSALSDSSREDRQMGGGEPIMSPGEIQRQIQELQRLQIASQDQQPVYQRRSDENLPRAYAGEYYVQTVSEKTAPAPAAVPSTMSIPAAYWQERHMASGGYTPPPQPVAPPGSEQPVYLMPAPTGMYQAPPTMRPVTNQLGQGYYAMQRMVPDVYRDAAAMYGMGPPQHQPQPQAPPPSQAAKVGMAPYAEGGGVGLVRQPPAAAAGGVPVSVNTETGYTQVGYDSAGRQVYYTSPGGMMPQYQTVSAASVDVRQTGALNPDGKLTKVSQASL